MMDEAGEISQLISQLKETVLKLEAGENLKQSAAVSMSTVTKTTGSVAQSVSKVLPAAVIQAKAPTEVKSTFYEKYSQEFIDFTYKNPTSYHVVEHFRQLLIKAGFRELKENEVWDNSNFCGSKGFVIRNGTSIVAFNNGENWSPENGVAAICCHIDALTVKLKPFSKKSNVQNYELLGVAPYSGTLNEAWFDRDLGIAGKVLYKAKDSSNIRSKLINSAPHPIAKIPSLAPHFGSPAVGPFDKEDKAVPIIGYSDGSEVPATDDEKNCPLIDKHSIALLRYVAYLAEISVSELIQFDLELFDVQKGSFGGLKNDFLFAPRLDDRLCSFAAMNSFIESSKSTDALTLNQFKVVALYDNEEVGSLSKQGAKGGLMETTLSRCWEKLNYCSKYGNTINYKDNLIATAYANSIILSADVIHLLNPNFQEVYLENHSPKPNVGITISLDPNGHMATDVLGLTFCELLAARTEQKLQYFQIKNNSRSGGTIGPSLATQTGARTIDLGIAQLSMHSIRAATGIKDIGLAVRFFNQFYSQYSEVKKQIKDW